MAHLTSASRLTTAKATSRQPPSEARAFALPADPAAAAAFIGAEAARGVKSSTIGRRVAGIAPPLPAPQASAPGWRRPWFRGARGPRAAFPARPRHGFLLCEPAAGPPSNDPANGSPHQELEKAIRDGGTAARRGPSQVSQAPLTVEHDLIARSARARSSPCSRQNFGTPLGRTWCRPEECR